MNRNQKLIISTSVVVCLVLAVVAGWALGALRSQASAAVFSSAIAPARYGQEGLRVSGTAVVRAAPDVATIRLGYESRHRKAREAKVANDKVMKKVIAAMEKERVASKDIQTIEYRLFPVWENWPTPTTRTLFWHVLHMVEVRVRNAERVAEVIDAASAAGADKVENVVFAIDSLHKLRTQAREMAAKIAQEKAEQLAGLLGARLGKVVAIVDSSARYYESPWSWYGRGYPSITAQAVAEAPSADTTPDSLVRGGQVVVEAREELVFALE